MSDTRAKPKRRKKPEPKQYIPFADRGLVSCADVAEYLDMCGKTVRKLVTLGKFPKPVKVGSLVKWNPKIVVAWRDKQQG